MNHHNTAGCAAVTSTASSIIEQRLATLLQRLEDLANRADGKLAPISRSGSPTGDPRKAKEVGLVHNSMPAYFEQLAGLLYNAATQVATIEDAIDRVEI